MGKRLELLRQVVPMGSRLAIVWNAGSPVETLAYQDLSAAAAVIGFALEPVAVGDPDGFPAAFATLAAGRPDALYAFGNPPNFGARRRIAEFCLQNRLPGVFEERLFVQAGGLMSYAPSFADMFRRAAGYVDRILKGANPGDLPIEHPAKFELALNVTTARTLGLDLPPALLAFADELIE